MRRAVRTERPDVIFLQECPVRDFELDREAYVRCSSAKSHCGFVCTYVRRDFKGGPAAALESPLQLAQIIAFPALPVVGVLFDLEDVGTLCIANCHLAPHSDGAATRAEQISAVGSALSDVPELAAPDAVLLAGDMNMRNQEVASSGRRFGAFPFPLRHCAYDGHRYGLVDCVR